MSKLVDNACLWRKKLNLIFSMSLFSGIAQKRHLGSVEGPMVDLDELYENANASLDHLFRILCPCRVNSTLLHTLATRLYNCTLRNQTGIKEKHTCAFRDFFFFSPKFSKSFNVNWYQCWQVHETQKKNTGRFGIYFQAERSCKPAGWPSIWSRVRVIMIIVVHLPDPGSPLPLTWLDPGMVGRLALPYACTFSPKLFQIVQHRLKSELTSLWNVKPFTQIRNWIHCEFLKTLNWLRCELSTK